METSQSPKIFIVDDDIFCREIYEQHLRNLGYKDIISFSNGEDCISQLDQNPDIIFLDQSMEPVNGIEMLKIIKCRNPAIYLVMISADNSKQVTADAFKSGAFEYIPKGENDLNMIATIMQKIFSVIEILNKPKASHWKKLFAFV